MCSFEDSVVIPEFVMKRRHLLKLVDKLVMLAVVGKPFHDLSERGCTSIDLSGQGNLNR
jgi:hypothetical protein